MMQTVPSRATGRALFKGVNLLNFIWDKITEWLKGLLVSGILSNLNGLFDSINSKVGEVAAMVGQTPQSWNSSIFSMVRSLSDNVMIPIAGVILTLVSCMELIQMLIDRNNMHDTDVALIFRWVMKTSIATMLVTNTWNIVMGIFDVAQSVVSKASGVVLADTAIDLSAVLGDLEARLMEMEVGTLFGLWFQSTLMGLIAWALKTRGPAVFEKRTKRKENKYGNQNKFPDKSAVSNVLFRVACCLWRTAYGSQRTSLRNGQSISTG